MTNVPLEEQTKESLIAYIQSLEASCEAKDAAAQKARVELGRAGLTEKRLREAGELLLEQMKPSEGWEAVRKLKAALALPKTQAEKDVIKIRDRVRLATQHLAWSIDELERHPNGNGLQPVKPVLEAALKELDACREAGLE